MRLRGFSVVLAVAGAIAACGNGFSSASGSNDAAADGPPPGDDTDATTEASSSSGGPGQEAGHAEGGGTPDGPVTVESGGTNWCATHGVGTRFCEDFDEAPDVTALLGSWTTYAQSGGTFSFDHLNVPSPPNALEVVTTSTSNVNTLVLHAMPKPVGTPVKQRLEFDLRIDQAAGTGVASAAAFAAILYGGEVNAGAVALAFGASPALAAVYIEPPDAGLPGFGTANASGSFPALGTWDGRFAIEITFAGSAAGACAQLYIGVQPQLSPCLSLPGSLSHPKSTSIALGVYSGGLGNSGNVGLRFDDVTYSEE